MRNTHTRCKTYTRSLKKCKKRFIAYNDTQWKYSYALEEDESIVDIIPNIKLLGLELGDNYTSDFLCSKKDKSLLVIECVDIRYILKPLTCKMLDASREYWLKKGVTDFRLVIGIHNECK